MAYRADLRSKVLETVDAGRGTKTALAAVFGVTRQWINPLLRRRAAERAGALPPKKKTGPKPKLGPADEERLRQLHAAQPDATVAVYHQRLGAAVGPWTVWKTLRRLGLSFKKRPCVRTNVNVRMSSPRGTPGRHGSRPERRPGDG